MRIIYKDPADHNESALRRAFTAGGRQLVVSIVLCGILAVALAGCGDTDNDAAVEGDATPSESGQMSGPVQINSAGWLSLRTIGNRIVAGDPVSLEEMYSVGDENAFLFWSRCLDANVPSRERLGRWIEGAFWEELGRDGPMKMTSDRRAMIASYRYSYQNRETIDRLLGEWKTGDQNEKFWKQANLWIDPAKLPSPLTVRFLPTLPELRYCSGDLLVDTGVLAAGGNRQLTGQLVALLYRNLEVIPAPEGEDPSGESGVANAFRIMASEGIATWIEKSPYTFFRQDHPSLHKVAMVPENFYLNGVRSVKFMNRLLPTMFADAEIMREQGPIFHVEAGAGGTMAQAGYAMVATIHHQLGEKRLLAVRGSASDFLAAYQEAALLNPVPQPVPGSADSKLPESQVPLDAAVYDQVQELLTRIYPR